MIAISHSETSHSTALADCPEIKIKNKSNPRPDYKKVANTHDETHRANCADGECRVRPRRVHRGKSPVAGDSFPFLKSENAAIAPASIGLRPAPDDDVRRTPAKKNRVIFSK